MPHDSIQEKLKSIKRWQFVPGKSKILPVLEALINKDEYIVDVIDGFFPASEDEKRVSDDSGLILVTDKTVILIRSEFPDEYKSFNKNKITNITCVKNFSSLEIKIFSDGGWYSFVTPLSEFAVKNIFSAAGKPVVRDNASGRGPVIINTELSGALKSEEYCHIPSVPGLLYPEVKKINSRLVALFYSPQKTSDSGNHYCFMTVR